MLIVLSIAAAVLTGAVAGGSTDPFATFDQQMAAPMTAADYQLGAIVVLHLTIGTIVGMWALVQGIFAVILKRGRGYGIAAIIIAVAAPVFSLIVYFLTSGVIIATRM